MWLVDQLLCGSGLTPAISCTRFKIQSAHADSPVAKTGFLRFRFRKGQLCFIDQETQEENVLSGPTPLWVSPYTSYLLYKVQDPFSACRKSHSQNIFFVIYFFNVLGRFGFASRSKKSTGRECAWWTKSLVGQFLHQLSLVQSSRSIQHMQTVKFPKQFFNFFNFLGRSSLCFINKEELGKRTSLVDQLPCGSVLTPAISCTKIYLAHAGHAKCLNKCLSVSSTFLFLLRHF